MREKSLLDRSLENLKQEDLYSIALFNLYKLTNDPGYASLCEMVYILDNDSFQKLREYFGGQTIRIPTNTEFESLIYALVLYQWVNVEHKDYNESIQKIGKESKDIKQIKTYYRGLVDNLKDYSVRMPDDG